MRKCILLENVVPGFLAPSHCGVDPVSWGVEGVHRAEESPPYPPGFRRQRVELVRAGRTPEELSRELGPTAQSISNWVKQADLDEGKRQDGLIPSWIFPCAPTF